MRGDSKLGVSTGGRRLSMIGFIVMPLAGVIACRGEEPVETNRVPASIADGVSREDSIAAGALRRLSARTAELNAASECVVQAGAPNRVGECILFPVPTVSPETPWLEHNGSSIDGAIQTAPITIEFARGIKTVRVEGWGPLSCSGDLGRVTAFWQGAQVFSAANSLMNPVDDCGEDDQAGGVVSILPTDLMVDRLVIDGVNPWTYTHPNTGAVAHARLLYGIFWPDPQSVSVLCTPPNPTRGDSIHCKTSLAVPDSYAVVQRIAFGTDFFIEDTISSMHAPGDTNSWDGIAVGSTDVQVVLQLWAGSATQTRFNRDFGHFDVQARAWPVWRLTTLALFLNTVVVAPFMTPYPLPPPDTTVLGLFTIDYPDTRSTLAMPTSQPTGGPNQGLSYIRGPYVLSAYRIATHPALYPPTKTTVAGAKQWYQDQNGRGSGTCRTSAQIAGLASNVERHEGRTMAQNSHFGVANRKFAELQLQQVIESMHSQKPDSEFRIEVSQKLTEIDTTGPYDAAQDSFDLADLLNVYTVSPPCTFDFNPNDR